MSKTIHTILKILFPFVFGLFIWICFLSGDQTFDLSVQFLGYEQESHVIILEILEGIFICGSLLFASLFIYIDITNEDNILSGKYKLIYKFYRFVCILSGIMAVLSISSWIAFIPFGRGIYYIVIELFSPNYKYVAILLITFTLLTLLFLIGLALSVRENKHIRLILFLRLAFWSNLYFSCVILIICNFKMLATSFSSDSVPMGMTALVLTVYSCYVLYRFLNNINLIVYEKKSFILYLRSFISDNNQTSILKGLALPGLPVLKIGNPSVLLQQGHGDILYLPTLSWKRQVSYYVAKAKYIICTLDSTDGVAWEIFEHQEFLDKFIYHFCNKETLSSILRKVPVSQNGLLISWLSYFRDNHCSKGAFWIKSNSCFFSDSLYDMVDFVINATPSNNIIALELDSCKTAHLVESVKENSDINLSASYKRINLLANIKYWIKASIKISITVLGIIFIIILKIFAILLLLGGLFIIFWPNVEWFEYRNIWLRLLGILPCYLGYKCLKDE